MFGAKRLKNLPRRNRFLNVYSHVVIITFLITLGAALVIEVSFAQADAKLKSSAIIPLNSTNLLNEKLRQKEAVLTQKEVELQREESHLTEVITANEAKILVYLFSISGALFLLILLNFFFDYQRRKSHVE